MSPAVQTSEPANRRLPFWRRVLVPTLLIGGAAVAVALIAMMPAPEPPAVQSERPPVNVRVQRLVPVPELPDMFELTAIVEPRRIVKVAAEVAGRIERYGSRGQKLVWRGATFEADRPLAEGQPVSAGDPLIFLNTDLLRARLDRARAQFEFDEREYQRLEALLARGTTSQREVDDARSKRDISKGMVDELAYELERATIVAPIGGVLNKLPREIGEYAQPGDVVAEIVDSECVKIAVEIPERDVGFFELGEKAWIAPLATPDAWCEGTITYLDSVANPATRTTRMELTIDNRDGRLRSGQIVRARLVRQVLADVLMIPLGSVVPLEVGYEVYVVENGLARRRPVKLGFIKGRDVRVESGLEPGQLLIIEGQRFVSDGQPVRVVE